jgi:hypothetical protein
MAWTSEESAPVDLALDRAWDALNGVLDHRVPLSVQMRVTVSVHDLLCFVTLLRSLERAEVARSTVLEAKREEWSARGDWRKGPPPDWDSHRSFQFAAALKAAFYFVRALQDSVYAALLEATGQHSGHYASMQSCATRPTNPIRGLIELALPDYFVWFAELRALRNQMKLGLSTAFSYRGAGAQTEVCLIVQEIDNGRRNVSNGRHVSLVDIERCLSQSTRLLEWVAAHVASTVEAGATAG